MMFPHQIIYKYNLYFS